MFVLKTAGGCGRSPSAIRQTRTCRRSVCLTPPRHLAVSILPPRENSRFPDPFPKVRLFRIKKPLVGAEGVRLPSGRLEPVGVRAASRLLDTSRFRFFHHGKTLVFPTPFQRFASSALKNRWWVRKESNLRLLSYQDS